MKKLRLSGLMALILAAVLVFGAVSASADDVAYEIPGTRTQVTLPEGSFIITPETGLSDGIWQDAGIDNIATTQAIYKELDVCSHFVVEGVSVYVSVKTTQQTDYYYDLSVLPQDTLEDLAELYVSDTGVLKAVPIVYHTDDIPFIRVDMEMTAMEEEDNLYELLYFTIVNGSSVTFRVTGEEPINEAQSSTLLDITESFTVTEVIPKANPVNPVKSWTLLIAAVAIVAFYIFYGSYSKKRTKRKNQEMADRLIAFREADHKNPGQVLFVNDTDHTPEAIRRFSKYQAYRKNPWNAILWIGITVLGTVVSIVADSQWYITLILAALAAYCLYKFITGAGTIERAVTKVFTAQKSTVAHYEFYENEFVISGIQSRTNYPYFKITEVVTNGDQVYIYFGEGTTYFVSADSFLVGDMEGFRKFIKEKTKK